MIIDNKISPKVDGPTLIFGITLLIPGIGFIGHREWVPGIAMVALSAFLFLTYSGIEIDTQKNAVKKYRKLFGLIKLGKWQSLDHYVGVTLVPMKKVRRTFSRSNRQVSTNEKYYMIFLVNRAHKPEFPIKKCKDPVVAQNSLDELAIWLKLPVYSIKR